MAWRLSSVNESQYSSDEKQKSFPQKREMVIRMSLCATDVKTNANIFYKSLIFIGFSNANNLSNMKISLQIKGFAAY